MYIKQLCVFLENSCGKLELLTEVLAKNDINLISMSISDTNDFGVVRLIVSDPNKAQDCLVRNGFASIVNDIMAVKIPHKPGSLNGLLRAFSQKGINVEYAYALTSGDNASILMKTSNDEMASKIIKEKYGFCEAEEIYNM